MGPLLHINGEFLDGFTCNQGKAVRWEQAWPLIRGIIEDPGPNPSAWVLELQKETLFGHVQPRVYCAVSESDGEWAETLTWGPWLYFRRTAAQRLPTETSPFKAVEWTEAWPALREYIIKNYVGQLRMDWMTWFLRQLRANN